MPIHVEIDVDTAGVPQALKLASRLFHPAIRDATDKTLDSVLSLFEQSVQHWDTRPAFNKAISGVGSRITGTAGTANDIYSLVSRGSPPHYIPVRTASQLAFQPFFRPKTAINTLQSRSGGKYGPIQPRGVIVWHPGFQGRQYDQQIYDALRNKDLFPQVTVKEIRSSMVNAGLQVIGFRR